MIEEKNLKYRNRKTDPSENENRTRLLDYLPVIEKRVNLSGISTSYLQGGEGPPIILLHGPGENVLWWMRIIPGLVKTHKVIVPDLPGHGASYLTTDNFKAEKIFSWLNDLIERTCPEPPVLIGHVLGGAIAARYAIREEEKIKRLILVDSLGLGKFRPSLRFAFGLIRFMMKPTRKNYHRFLPQCMYDTNILREQMDMHWDIFLDYNIECANNPGQQKAMQIMMKHLGIPKIPSESLDGISVPTFLIWGRYDRANKLKIGEKASNRYGWPLYIIEDTRDDPKLEKPDEFVRILYKILEK